MNPESLYRLTHSNAKITLMKNRNKRKLHYLWAISQSTPQQKSLNTESSIRKLIETCKKRPRRASEEHGKNGPAQGSSGMQRAQRRGLSSRPHLREYFQNKRDLILSTSSFTRLTTKIA